MSIETQAKTSDSRLRTFLDEWLPRRSRIIERWERELADAPCSAWEGAYDRSLLGQAAEFRISLDVAPEPPTWPVLSYLSPTVCTWLLEAVGFGARDLSHLPDSGTRDPLLRAWTRMRHPLRADNAEQQHALGAALDALRMDEVAHHVGHRHPVALRRAMNLGLRHTQADELPPLEQDDPTLAAFTHLWTGYLLHGRTRLFELGERVVVSPILAPGFATADLTVGHTLVEIKAVAEPGAFLAAWLDQVLGYLLCDRWNLLGITQVAVYSAWHARLLPAELGELLDCAAGRARPNLGRLRQRFRIAMSDDLDDAEYWYLRRHGPGTR